MKPLISIVIPTCNSYKELLKPCIDSILEYTSMHNVEIIVVNNDQPNHEKIFFTSLPIEVKLISYPQKMGYPFACNRGIEIAQGEYIILLNNDCILLDQPKNQWINQLIEPFFINPSIGITGVFKKHIPEIGRDFVLFFCAMIKKEVFEKTGLLNEKCGIGYTEDMEKCIEAEDAGYKVVSVPKDELADKFDGSLYVSDFQIYHSARQTMNTISDEATESYNKNFKTLIEKYKK